MPLNEHDIRAALPLWPQLAGTEPRLINHSENHTFRLDGPGRFVLRVHRPGYQSVASIMSELNWLESVRRDTDVPVPEPVPGVNGELLQFFETPNGEQRHGVVFRFIVGTEPQMGGDLVPLFRVLGDYAARLHLQTIGWERPAGFDRQAWSAAAILDADGLWGDWRIAPGVTDATRALLEQAAKALSQRLAEYGTGTDRYGLIHADMRLGNLLVEGEKVSLIDFDDCGFCWFAYDFAAAVSFYETHDMVPALKAAWIEGYTKVRALSADDVAAIDDMVLLRRFALLAWIGSHNETALAQTHMPGFAEGTAALARRFLET